MATKVIMPKQGLQMTEGTIISWLASEGDQVEEGKPIFEMETDKLTIEIGAPVSGTLLKIVRGEGDVVPITETIAFIGEAGEDISGLLAEVEGGTADAAAASATGAGGEVSTGATTEAGDEASTGAGSATPPAATAPTAVPTGRTSPATAGGSGTAPSDAAGSGRSFSSPRARMRAEEKGLDINTISGSGPDGLVIERDVLSEAEAPGAASTVGASVGAAAAPTSPATPLARKVAAAGGVDLAGLEGTGPRGKIYKRDVEAAATAQAAAEQRASQTAAAAGVTEPAASAASPAKPSTAKTTGIKPPAPREDRLVKLTGMRRTIAARMRESLDTAAQAVHRVEVDMSEVVRMRSNLKKAGSSVSYNDIVLKATAAALRSHPRMNSIMTDEGILEHGAVHLGVAVAVEEGLLVPVIRDADLLTLSQIHSEARRLGEAARSNTLNPDEMGGGTFSVSNLGMFEIDSFTAIINRPESGILAVGAIKEKPVVVGGGFEARPLCQLSLTYDHGVIDGAPAAEFLRDLKRILENPYLLV